MRTTAGTRFIPGSWHRRKADARWWASSEVVWECRLARDEDAVDSHTSQQEHPSPFTKGGRATSGDLLSQGLFCRSVQALDSQGSLQAAALNAASGIGGCSPPGSPVGRGGTERSLTLEEPLQGRDTGPSLGRPCPGRAAVVEAGDAGMR